MSADLSPAEREAIERMANLVAQRKREEMEKQAQVVRNNRIDAFLDDHAAGMERIEAKARFKARAEVKAEIKAEIEAEMARHPHCTDATREQYEKMMRKVFG